ncbi:unnamed protein product [Lactuca virosa]|uniref:Glycoside hydrolase 35 catalytic domain-containing protein n=1 Tax=Lactuca virosa TaxID=75947 RepID=A0AAU9MKG8_9ASTR|nr:unnamed protein product [Lactuca virosa]
MRLAVIDCKDSKFEKDLLYEDINAPQWIDFTNHDPPVDDAAWFCRPDFFVITGIGEALNDLNGKRRILISGSIHYPRNNPEVWPDLIQKAK